LIVLFHATLSGADEQEYAMDDRAYQHGINFVPRSDNQWLLIWSSSGNPPQGEDQYGNWTHDVYYSLVDARKPIIRPQLLISRPGAQEPVSAAVTDDGYLMITMEDGWNTEHEVEQRFALFDLDLLPVKNYPQLVQDGGHSGHLAAVGNRFVVFYSDEWVNGGGVNDLGSGDDVLIRVYSSRGELQHTVPVAVSKTSRDWWPLLAASSRTVMLIWQRFVNDQKWCDLMMAMLDPETGDLLKKPIKIASNLKYYTYNVAYLPKLGRFLVTATGNNDTGFARLYSENGDRLSRLTTCRR
jgi:hypothetical protein